MRIFFLFKFVPMYTELGHVEGGQLSGQTSTVVANLKRYSRVLSTGEKWSSQ